MLGVSDKAVEALQSGTRTFSIDDSPSTMTYSIIFCGAQHGAWRFLIVFLAFSVAEIHANYTVEASNHNSSDIVHLHWDAHIKDLEKLLEVDLFRVEHDAKDAVDHNQLNGILTEDLLHVRQDIDRLVASIKDVEDELGRTKHKIDEEERDIQQKSAQMETEKILDGLHRGKLAVKVDYVTGELVSRSLKRKRRRISTNSTMAEPATNATAFSQIKTPAASGALQQQNTDGWDEVVNAGTTGDNNDDDKFIDQKKKASETVRQHIESHPDIKSRIKEEMEFLKSGSDPAVLNFDANLMLDIVKLAMTASLFGLAAVFLKLPPTAGFLLGGMLIGPSCLDLVGEIHQVQTLAQFGAIFLLFEQGLLYSQTYADDPLQSQASEELQMEDDGTTGLLIPMMSSPSSPRSDKNIYSRFSPKHPNEMSAPHLSLPTAPSFLTDDDHDPNIVGSIILTLLVFVGLVVVFFTNVASTVLEAIMVSCTIALCSTTIVAETLHTAHIADTQWGIGVLKMIVSRTALSIC